MSFVVLNIVEVSMSKIALWINVHVDDWVGESTIIASNENFSVKLRSVFGESFAEKKITSLT